MTGATNSGDAVRRGAGGLDDQAIAQPVPVSERVPDGPVQLADPHLPADRGRQDRSHDLLHRPQGRERRSSAPTASASTRTSSTLAAWRRRTTWRSSGPARSATWAARRRGTTCRRGAAHWIKGPDEGAAAIGLEPLLSGAKTEDEGLFAVQHRYWMETMQRRIGEGPERWPERPSRHRPSKRTPVPVPRGALPGRQGMGRLAGAATPRTPSSGCRPGTMTTGWSSDPKTRDLADLLRTRAGWKTGCSASGPNAAAPPACPSRARGTTSATSRSPSRTTATASCGSTGSR